ncbi:hypothetical protein M569_16264, partial [Genlisea aurea]
DLSPDASVSEKQSLSSPISSSHPSIHSFSLSSGDMDSTHNNPAHAGPTGDVDVTFASQVENPHSHNPLHPYPIDAAADTSFSVAAITTPIPQLGTDDAFDSGASLPTVPESSPCSLGVVPASGVDGENRAAPSESSFPMLVSGPPRQHSMVTRSQSGIFKPNPKYALHMAHHRTLPSEPRGVRQALQHPGWKMAMDEELEALHRNQTWTLVKGSAGGKGFSSSGWN